MIAAPIRCPAPHPRVPGWVCNHRLLDAVPGTVDVRPADHPPPGCILLKCPSCGARYVACARDAA